MKIADIPDIDAPIVDILERMNRLGFLTHFSCCGYDYHGQTRKSHDGCPYILFHATYEKVVKLGNALEGYWIIKYSYDHGRNQWTIRYGVGHDRVPSVRDKKHAWKVLGEALCRMEEHAKRP